MDEQLLKKVNDLINEYLDEPCEITMDTHIIRDLEINSFDYTNIITDIEDEFHITIDDLSLYRVKDLTQVIAQSLNKEVSE
jgi:acyl carrier protein